MLREAVDRTPYLLKSSPTTAYSGTTVFSIDSGYDSQHITGLVPGDYTFYARISNTADGGTVYLYAEIPVRVVATSATVNVFKLIPNYTTYSLSTGNNGTQPGGTTFTPTSNGTQVTISVTTRLIMYLIGRRRVHK